MDDPFAQIQSLLGLQFQESIQFDASVPNVPRVLRGPQLAFVAPEIQCPHRGFGAVSSGFIEPQVLSGLHRREQIREDSRPRRPSAATSG